MARRQTGELIGYFPGSVEAQAARLEDEGIRIVRAGKAKKVKEIHNMAL